jgi:hypothetical protein
LCDVVERITIQFFILPLFITHCCHLTVFTESFRCHPGLDPGSPAPACTFSKPFIILILWQIPPSSG